MKKLKKHLEESSRILDLSKKQKDDITRRLQELQVQLQKAESERKEVRQSCTRAESEHSKTLNTYKLKQNELIERLKASEKKLKVLESNSQKKLTDLQESLEREHSVTMEKMKSKMIELRSNHLTVLETLRKQHVSENKMIQDQLDKLREQRRGMSHTPTQVRMN